MKIVIDIETLPGHLNRREEDMADIAENVELKCSLNKGQIIAELGDPQLKYKTLDELKPMWIEANKEKAVEEVYRKRALDGTYGTVCSIAFKQPGAHEEPISMSLASHDNEQSLLQDFVYRINGMCKRSGGNITQPLFIGHNVIFDLKFLFRRVVINMLYLDIDLPFGGWHGKDYFCTSQAWCGRDGRISQNNLCKALGIEGKPGDICGANVYDHALEGDFKRIEEYNIDDILKCEQVYRRLAQ